MQRFFLLLKKMWRPKVPRKSASAVHFTLHSIVGTMKGFSNVTSRNLDKQGFAYLDGASKSAYA